MIESFHDLDPSVSKVAKFVPAKIRYDKNGIPIFSICEIEAIAEELLHKYCPQVLAKPGITNVGEIIERLHASTGLLFAMAELGHRGTAKILGKVSFRRRLLLLDFSLEGERKAAFRFTGGHEIGHWVLHRYNYQNWIFESSSAASHELADDDCSLCRLEQKTQKDWLEFHANVFAASLVTPRKTFVVALIEAQLASGIKRNLGRVFLSKTEYSQRDFESVVNQLSQVFDVSKEAVRVRMKTLQLIDGEIEASRVSKIAKKLFASD
jgi:Zn-dependent peptidase ImmA (M78 family)